MAPEANFGQRLTSNHKMIEDSKLAREIAQETVAALRANETPRTRRIDWNQTILLFLAVGAAIWAVFTFCIDAKLAPYDKRAALIEQAQKQMMAEMQSSFKRLDKKFDLMTAGVSPAENDEIEGGQAPRFAPIMTR